MDYRIRQTNQALKTSEIWNFSDADEAIEYVKNYIAHNASDLFFGGVILSTIYDGVSEKNMMRNVIFEVPKLLTMSHLGFKYDPTFEHDERSAKDIARGILRLMKKGDLEINTENPLAWKLRFNLNSRMIILFDFPYLFRVKTSFTKIESLKKRLREKDIKIKSLEKHLIKISTKFDSQHQQLIDLKISYVDLLKSTDSDATVECPPCVYVSGNNCKNDCFACQNCGKRHLNCKGCEYHFECQECGDRCCDTCGNKCPVCKGYTCYICGHIVCMKCHPKTSSEKAPKFYWEVSLESLG